MSVIVSLDLQQGEPALPVERRAVKKRIVPVTDFKQWGQTVCVGGLTAASLSLNEIMKGGNGGLNRRFKKKKAEVKPEETMERCAYHIQ